MNALKTNKFKVGDEVEIVKLDKTMQRFGGASLLKPVGTKAFVTWVAVTGGKVEIDADVYTYHADDLTLVKNEVLETQAYNPLIAQEGGGHYKNRGIQPIEYSEANNLGACQHSVVKYITRHQDKNGVEDLGKIIHFTLLEAFFKYGIEGSTDLKKRVLKMLGEDKESKE